jgi:protein-disulfide isomerase
MRGLVAVLALAQVSFAAMPRLIEGNPESPVRVLIYEDLQCPDCANFRVMMDRQILPKYAGKAAFEHRDFPLPKHKWARKAAIAARYFETVKPELAVEWRRYALAHLGEITPENFSGKLSEWAGAHGADRALALAALDDKALAAAVEEDYQEGVARGIAHTPTVLVDGEPFVETFSFEDIARSLDKATSGK